MTTVFTSVLERISNIARWQKQSIVFFLDTLLCIQSIWIAYSLRIGVWIYWDLAIQKIALGALLAMIPAFYFAGVYKAIFRYAGSGMMKTLVRAFLFYSFPLVVIFSIVGIAGVPRTVGVIQPIIFFILVGFSRVTARYLMLDVLNRNQFIGEIKNVLIYGAGNAGQQLAASIQSEPAMRLHGFVDDDNRLNGQKLDGNKVFWSGQVRSLIEKYGITDILLALPNISRTKRRMIVDEFKGFKVHIQTLPNMKEILDGRVSFSDIRELDIEDLLGREPVAPNDLLRGRTIVGKTVLVTGAGGSIGSELCLQIARIGARQLILYEISEFSLYAIDKELRSYAKEHGKQLDIIPLLGSVTDAQRLAFVFSRWKPDTVFHAAAYKHVPLVEANPVEGVRNNIMGTFEVVNAARVARSKDFILVSTDKAVRPTNIMGATKRGAEQIVQAFASKPGPTKYSMVRFGNVLGSSGSVVPLFRKQIEAGGPITLTHRDVTRFFMTIPEAAMLVIQAGGLAKGGEVFVLDMGKSVKIIDLARAMVQLSGLSVKDAKHPDGDIKIEEVGLRPGEKLFEELIIGNNPTPTMHERIMMAQESFTPWPELIKILHDLASCRDRQDTIDLLQTLVPEFKHRRDNDDIVNAS